MHPKTFGRVEVKDLAERCPIEIFNAPGRIIASAKLPQNPPQYLLSEPETHNLNASRK
jgi:hypothetical protein